MSRDLVIAASAAVAIHVAGAAALRGAFQPPTLLDRGDGLRDLVFMSLSAAPEADGRSPEVASVESRNVPEVAAETADTIASNDVVPRAESTILEPTVPSDLDAATSESREREAIGSSSLENETVENVVADLIVTGSETQSGLSNPMRWPVAQAVAAIVNEVERRAQAAYAGSIAGVPSQTIATVPRDEAATAPGALAGGDAGIRSATVIRGRNDPPNYPSVARRRGYEGIVEVRVEVLVDGGVGGVRVCKSSGHAVLDDAAVRAVRRWRFTPAARGGDPIVSWGDIPIVFRLER